MCVMTLLGGHFGGITAAFNLERNLKAKSMIFFMVDRLQEKTQ